MLLRALADRISEVTYDALPAEAVEVAKQGILDTVGVTLAGARDETTAVVASALRQTAAAGPALIFGTSDHVDVLNAALINGTASHALDFDDCSNSLGGHPSAPILPALWAIAPGSSGKAFIAAYAAGVECETRFARAVNFHHYEKGWHPTATLGTFGSAAACGHLLALSPEQLATALALAASMASGIKANFGTMTKPFHVGHTTRNGLLAALLAKEGMTANAGALEHPQGFFAVYNGAGNFNADRLLDHWGDPFDLVDPGIAFKRHPCCGSTHPAVDAMLYMRETHGLVPERVAKVESWTHPRRLATHQPAQSAERPRRQVLDPIRARACADARHRQHGAFQRRGRARSGDARADDARALGARSGREAGDQRSLLLPPQDHDHGRRDASSISSTVRSAATVIIRCRRARWRRNSAIARRPCSMRRRSKRCSTGVSRLRRLQMCPTFSTSSRPASRRRRSHRAAAPMHDVSENR